MYNSYSALNLLGGMLYTMILLVIAYFAVSYTHLTLPTTERV